MKTAIIILAALIVSILFFDRSGPLSGGAPAQVCPPGYTLSGVNSTWAGWSFNCLPIGIESSLVSIPSDTYTRPMTTIYSPVVANTGCTHSGELARTLEFPVSDLQSLFPRYRE